MVCDAPFYLPITHITHTNHASRIVYSHLYRYWRTSQSTTQKHDIGRVLRCQDLYCQHYGSSIQGCGTSTLELFRFQNGLALHPWFEPCWWYRRTPKGEPWWAIVCEWAGQLSGWLAVLDKMVYKQSWSLLVRR